MLLCATEGQTDRHQRSSNHHITKGQRSTYSCGSCRAWHTLCPVARRWPKSTLAWLSSRWAGATRQRENHAWRSFACDTLGNATGSHRCRSCLPPLAQDVQHPTLVAYHLVVHGAALYAPLECSRVIGRQRNHLKKPVLLQKDLRWIQNMDRGRYDHVPSSRHCFKKGARIQLAKCAPVTSPITTRPISSLKLDRV